MLIAAPSTVYALDPDDRAPTPIMENQDIQRVAEGIRCRVIALEGGDLVVFAEEDCRRLNTGIDAPIESILILEESPLHLLIGVEGPHIYRVLDGKTERLAGFEALPCRDDWHTPWGGPASVRSLAASQDGWIYADIHVGSIMRSPDRGESWEPVTPDLHEDVHQVAVSPVANDRLYANTARAVYISDDRGTSWAHRSDGFPYLYGRAIVVHPQDPDCVLATVSKGPHGDAQGKLYRSDDAGRSWDHVSDGYPESAAGNIDTFHLGFAEGGSAWSIVDRTLYRSEDRGRTWTSVWVAPEKLTLIDC